MTTQTRLSVSTSYYIRKLLRQYERDLQSFVAKGAGLSANSQMNLDQVLESLYIEVEEISDTVQQLEKLVQWHQILVKQYSNQAKIDRIEEQIFWLLGLKRVQSIPQTRCTELSHLVAVV